LVMSSAKRAALRAETAASLMLSTVCRHTTTSCLRKRRASCCGASACGRGSSGRSVFAWAGGGAEGDLLATATTGVGGVACVGAAAAAPGRAQLALAAEAVGGVAAAGNCSFPPAAPAPSRDSAPALALPPLPSLLSAAALPAGARASARGVPIRAADAGRRTRSTAAACRELGVAPAFRVAEACSPQRVTDRRALSGVLWARSVVSGGGVPGGVRGTRGPAAADAADESAHAATGLQAPAAAAARAVLVSQTPPGADELACGAWPSSPSPSRSQLPRRPCLWCRRSGLSLDPRLCRCWRLHAAALVGSPTAASAVPLADARPSAIEPTAPPDPAFSSHAAAAAPELGVARDVTTAPAADAWTAPPSAGTVTAGATAEPQLAGAAASTGTTRC
jgi:hypothetical protein